MLYNNIWRNMLIWIYIPKISLFCMCVRNLHFSFLVHAYLLFDTELKLHTMYMYIIKIETIISKNRFSTKTKKRENNMQILLFLHYSVFWEIQNQSNHGSFMRSIACPCSWFYLNLNLEKTGNKYLLSENIKRNSNHYKIIPDVCVTLILLFTVLIE